MKGLRGLEPTIAFSLAAIQIVDIVVHAATGQLEPLRVTSNVIILLWLAMLMTGRLGISAETVGAIAVAAYILLNVLFVAFEGVVNSAQGGAPRIVLVVLLLLTAGLSGRLIYPSARRPR